MCVHQKYSLQKKLKGVSSDEADMTNVNYEVGKLCNELRDLSERALKLREKLLANVVESANPDSMQKAASARYSRY